MSCCEVAVFWRCGGAECDIVLDVELVGVRITVSRSSLYIDIWSQYAYCIELASCKVADVEEHSIYALDPKERLAIVR